MSAILAVLANTFPSGNNAPPVPDLTGISALYSSFGIAAGWQNGNPLIFDVSEGAPFSSTASAPYPLDWNSIPSPSGDELGTWYDQSGGGFDATVGGLAPLIDAPTQRFTYNGTQNLATPTGVLTGNTLTIYCVFSTNDLLAAQTLSQSRYANDYLTNTDLFAIYLTAAGVLTVSQNTVDTIPVFNSKVKMLGDTNLHLLTVVFDRTISGAGATVMKVDNSTSGVSNGATADMLSANFDDKSIGIGLGQPLGTDAFLDGTLNECWIYSDAKDSTHQDSVYNYLKYLYPSIP